MRLIQPRQPRRPPAGTADRQRGSMAVEFVILAPLMLLLMCFLVLCGRVIEAHGQVDGAARDAARAASVARTAGEADSNALQAAQGDLRGWCRDGWPASAVTGFSAGSGRVIVTVRCQVDLKFIGYGSITVTGRAVAPLDTFEARS
jgi:Flp pilus assembly protein TadG